MEESSSARIWPSQEQHRRNRNHGLAHTTSARHSSPLGSSRPRTPSTPHSPSTDSMAAYASLPSPPPSSRSIRRPWTVDMAPGLSEHHVPPRAPSPPSLESAGSPASASKQQPTSGEQQQRQCQNGYHLHHSAGQFHLITPDASREQTPDSASAPLEPWCPDCRGDGENGHRKACLKAGNASSSSSGGNDSVPEALSKMEQQCEKPRQLAPLLALDVA